MSNDFAYHQENTFLVATQQYYLRLSEKDTCKTRVALIKIHHGTNFKHYFVGAT
jgi:hypothetical protein